MTDHEMSSTSPDHATSPDHSTSFSVSDLLNAPDAAQEPVGLRLMQVGGLPPPVPPPVPVAVPPPVPVAVLPPVVVPPPHRRQLSAGFLKKWIDDRAATYTSLGQKVKIKPRETPFKKKNGLWGIERMEFEGGTFATLVLQPLHELYSDEKKSNFEEKVRLIFNRNGLIPTLKKRDNAGDQLDWNHATVLACNPEHDAKTLELLERSSKQSNERHKAERQRKLQEATAPRPRVAVPMCGGAGPSRAAAGPSKPVATPPSAAAALARLQSLTETLMFANTATGAVQRGVLPPPVTNWARPSAFHAFARQAASAVLRPIVVRAQPLAGAVVVAPQPPVVVAPQPPVVAAPPPPVFADNVEPEVPPDKHESLSLKFVRELFLRMEAEGHIEITWDETIPESERVGLKGIGQINFLNEKTLGFVKNYEHFASVAGKFQSQTMFNRLCTLLRENGVSRDDEYWDNKSQLTFMEAVRASHKRQRSERNRRYYERKQAKHDGGAK